jgi:transcriptional regulator with XRE-family HTH domain
LPADVLSHLIGLRASGTPIGTVLATARRARGWTQARAGQEIGYSQTRICRAETGQAPLNSSAVQALLHALGVPDQVRQTLDSPDSSTRITVKTVRGTEPPATADPSEGGTTEVKRRAFLSSTSALMALGVLPATDKPRTTRANLDHAARIEQIAFQLRELDHDGGGAALLPTAIRQLHHARSLIDTATFTSPEVETALRSATGVLALTTAWLAYDADDQLLARSLYLDARNVAELTGNRNLAVDALNHLSHQATILNRPRDAIRYAHRATTLAHGWASPRLTALLALREARGHAASHDHTGTEHSLTRALTAFDTDHDTPDPYPWMGTLDPSEIAGQQGICRAELGNPTAAETALATVYAQRHQATHPRSRAHYWLRYAESLAAQNKIDHACDVAASTIPTIARIDSKRLRHRLHTLRRQLTTGPGKHSQHITHLENTIRSTTFASVDQ